MEEEVVFFHFLLHKRVKYLLWEQQKLIFHLGSANGLSLLSSDDCGLEHSRQDPPIPWSNQRRKKLFASNQILLNEKKVQSEKFRLDFLPPDNKNKRNFSWGQIFLLLLYHRFIIGGFADWINKQIFVNLILWELLFHPPLDSVWLET